MSALRAMRTWPVQARDALPTALWNAQEIAAATKGTARKNFEVSGVEIDSRDVRKGDLFVALKGHNLDGHQYIEKAFGNGAVAALVDRPIDYPHVLVNDTFEALEGLAVAARNRSEAVRIAITGSVGKTGVKEAIFQALDRHSNGTAHRSVRSYNNHVGVPVSLARMPTSSRFGVFELGMNHQGEIFPLAEYVRPHVALITTIAPAHIENLGSMEKIVEEKSMIFSGLVDGGTAIIPADSEYAEQIKGFAAHYGRKILTFGVSEGSNIRLLDAIPSANGGSVVTADLGDERVCYSIAEPGDHWIVNSLGILAAVKAVGGDLGAAGLALSEMGGLKGRGARHTITLPGGRAILIDESYNANPTSMRATLRSLGQTPASRRIAVLGSMKELGDFSLQFHKQLLDPICEASVDHVILVGQEMRPLAKDLVNARSVSPGTIPSLDHCDNPAEAIAALNDFGISHGDTILIKGSNSIGLGALVSHFTRENETFVRYKT